MTALTELLREGDIDIDTAFAAADEIERLRQERDIFVVRDAEITPILDKIAEAMGLPKDVEFEDRHADALIAIINASRNLIAEGFSRGKNETHGFEMGGERVYLCDATWFDQLAQAINAARAAN